MLISGFTMVKNADKLYYPIKESIESILPIVDEFVIALGDCDEDDHTRDLIESIDSNKVKIVDTVWDINAYPNGMENAHQTDIAKEHCKGEWCFYLQADEVIHEQYQDHIKKACEKYKNEKEVEGFLFKYKHFFGDYNHTNDNYGWYPFEIRIVRNDPEIHSYQSAQSFRRIPDFDGKSYRQREGTFKLKVIELDAYVYHYGWVRPPHLMQKKSKALDTIHKGEKSVAELYSRKAEVFDYGNMNLLHKFNGTHPKVMEGFIEKFDWSDDLHFEKDYKPTNRALLRHEKGNNKLTTFIANTLFNKRPFFGYKNWISVGRFKH
jgi:hypothetical protein